MLKKIFNLTDIKYFWLLALSMVTFVISLYLNKILSGININEGMIYSICFFIAILWSILNYISHLKINPMHKSYNTIESFVANLKMDKEEKAELTQYLNDFVDDLVEKGNTHDEAIKIAIRNFQVQEFSESNNSLFEMHVHYYLIGYGIILIGIIIVLQCLNMFFPNVFIILALNFTCGLYAFALFCLFFIYKFIDYLIEKNKVLGV